MLELKDVRLHGRYGIFMAVTRFFMAVTDILGRKYIFCVKKWDLFGLPAIYRQFHGAVRIIRI
jgi:hypothetical protein